MTWRRIAAASGVALLVLAGCTGTSGDSSGGPTLPAGVPEPSLAQLRAASALPACRSYGAAVRDSALPDVELRCLAEGPAVSLAGLRGPAVVNLWASWCRQCVTEMPILERVRQRAGDRVEFLGVDFKDDPEPALEAAASRGVTYPSVQDPDGELAADLRVTGLPVTLFVREDGTVAGRKDGEISSERELEDLLARHLGVRL